MPTPTAALVNAMGASASGTRGRRIVRGTVAAAPEARGLAVVEAAKVDVRTAIADLLPGSTVIQHGPVGSPEAALALAAGPGVPLLSHGLVAATRARNAPGRRRDIRARPILLAELDGVPVAVIHCPPPRMPLLRRRYLRRVRAVTAGRVVLGDWNVPRHRLRRMFPGAQIASEGEGKRDVLHVVARAPRGVKPGRVVPGWVIDGKPDHDVVVSTLHPHR